MVFIRVIFMIAEVRINGKLKMDTGEGSRTLTPA